jgi:hypothetical protein
MRINIAVAAEENTMNNLTADYLVVGSGAAGMAFCDVILQETDASIIVVDRHHAPGGHWNDAYPFVQLHQPSAYYGVCSRPLGTDATDKDPLNKGMLERATAAELLHYYSALMQDYVATGRVRYIPMSDYRGDGCVNMLLSDKIFKVAASRRTIDTTFLQTTVPATHPPAYDIADNVECITPNGLARLKKAYACYTVVGAGKTGVDTCLWLLGNGVAQNQVRWIMPRDCWFQNRANVQRGDAYFEATFGALAAQLEAVVAATSVEALLHGLEAKQQLLRLDPTVSPQMYHGAIMSFAELTLLRSIKNVVRLGRIDRITANQIILEQGVITSCADTIYIDCSASGLTRRPAVPVFAGDTVTLQMVRPIQPVFSAALIAFVETLDIADDEKNTLCVPTIIPDKPVDWLNVLVAGLGNQARWSGNQLLRSWIANTRLDTFGAMARSVTNGKNDRSELLRRFSTNIAPALANARKLIQSNV